MQLPVLWDEEHKQHSGMEEDMNVPHAAEFQNGYLANSVLHIFYHENNVRLLKILQIS